jgi:hypothetical protein
MIFNLKVYLWKVKKITSYRQKATSYKVEMLNCVKDVTFYLMGRYTYQINNNNLQKGGKAWRYI